jgi:hypothetical protein
MKILRETTALKTKVIILVASTGELGWIPEFYGEFVVTLGIIKRRRTDRYGSSLRGRLGQEPRKTSKLTNI